MPLTPDENLDLIFDSGLIPQGVKDELPDDLHIRPLASDDYTRGHLQILTVLTSTPDVGLEKWTAQYNHLKSFPSTYYPIVILEKQSDRIIAVGTLFMEFKFIRGCNKAGHIEDIAVDKSIQGKGLGKKVIQALTGISEKLGAYKVFLDCSEENKAFYEKCGYKFAGVQMSKYAPSS
ncbi:unnamed protein product [Sympodiomycopsis kandeliae]